MKIKMITNMHIFRLWGSEKLKAGLRITGDPDPYIQLSALTRLIRSGRDWPTINSALFGMITCVARRQWHSAWPRGGSLFML